MSATPTPGAGTPLSAERWARLQPLIDAALDLPAGDRAAYFESASSGDGLLRAELERRVAECVRGSTLIDGNPVEHFSSLFDALLPGMVSHGRLGRGAEIALNALRSALADRYRVEEAVGSGGMAKVYLAHDVRHDRRVAIKVLRPELAAAVGAQRFLREIRVTASLQHPHILPLYDSGEAAGLVYYVMPLVEGESLRARLDREGQLPLRDALDIASSVASALDYAHRRRLIHRDVKPENILLAGGGPGGDGDVQAMVADFGVAVAVASAGGDRMTESGIVIGTPTYMSPEQAKAERALGPESDVYALGVVVYEMLMGEPPFTGPSSQAVVVKLTTDLPSPLRPRRSSIPEHVEAAVLKSLAKLPGDRFASAAEFADALNSSGAVALPRATPEPNVRTSISRITLVVVALLAFMVGVAVTAVVMHAASAPTTTSGVPTPSGR